MENSYLVSSVKQFEYYKSLGDKTIAQLTFEELKKEFAQDANSISIHGDMLAIAVAAETKTDNGAVLFYSLDAQGAGTFIKAAPTSETVSY